MPKKRSQTELLGDKVAADAVPTASPMDNFKSLAKRLLVVTSDDLREARTRETEWACAGRPSNTRSGPSRPGWAPPTSDPDPRQGASRDEPSRPGL